ncbi:MAG: ATP-binding protein [Burkholderiaceae bacterium]
MHQLYLRIYFAVLAALVLFVLLAGLSFKLMSWGEPNDREMVGVVRELAAELLPADADIERTQATLDRWHQKFAANLSLFDGRGDLIAWVGARQMHPPDPRSLHNAREGDYWSHGKFGPQLIFGLPGDRFLVAVDERRVRGWRAGSRGLLFLIGVLTLVGLAVAIVAWPVARRLTRRLEQLQQSVQAFGAGDLTARATVRGKDEVARLAVRFNQSADYIEQLVASQRTLLANASHELKSPLARIRMAAELMSGPVDDAEKSSPASAELLRNVGELDSLVDEILLASRLEASHARSADRSQWSKLDLGGLVAEESARCGLSPRVTAILIVGDARLLRRLVRNLIENALRYGVRASSDAVSRPANDIDISLLVRQGLIVLSVCDRGPGVPSDEAEKIFEAFYRARGASERSGGVGLGLSLVRQIAKHHGGQVRCESRPGGGSCFVASFPDSLLEK